MSTNPLTPAQHFILAAAIEHEAAQACREITDVLERTLAVPRAAVRVLIAELPPEHWSVGGVTKAAGTERVEPGELR